MKTFLYVLLVLLAGDKVIAQEACTTSATKAATAVLDIQSKLLAITIGADDLPYDPPPFAKEDVPRLRNALVQTADSLLLCNTATSDAAKLQAQLVTLLHANAPDPHSPTEPPDTPERDIYGASLKIKAQQLQGLKNTIAVQFSFGTGCGDDNILLLYSRSGTFWKRVLDWHKDIYNTASDAFGDFFLYQLLPQPYGPPWIAIAHGHPWCSSRFSSFSTDLVQIATALSAQRILSHVDEGYIRFEEEPRIRRTADGIELRLEVGSKDGDRITRPGIVRFRTTTGTLERVQPVALNARDFVDAWLDAPWPFAKTLTNADPDALTRLKRVHDGFDYTVNKETPSLTLPETRACSDDTRHFQVKIEIVDKSPLFAMVQQDQRSFTLFSIAEAANPNCKGGNLMPLEK